MLLALAEDELPAVVVELAVVVFELTFLAELDVLIEEPPQLAKANTATATAANTTTRESELRRTRRPLAAFA